MPPPANYHLVVDLSPGPSDYRSSSLDITTMETSVEPLRAEHLGDGVIRLYREWEYEAEEPFSESLLCAVDAPIVAIVAVPSYFSATDILGFVGTETISAVTHLRLIRSITPHRQMVLMKFGSGTAASVFMETFNGQPFNSMERETCHAVVVQSVKIEGECENKGKGEFSLLAPFAESQRQRAEEASSTRNAKASPPSLRELPSCAVCLERMDATLTGLVTIPCQHTFHCHCLSKWRDDTCPVCRYSNRQDHPRNVVASPEVCLEAGCAESRHLWICLVCGHLACGRYNRGHALAHYSRTGHCFAMETQTERVWDYAGDKYVHRLLTNESDGKLVELEAPMGSASVSASASNGYTKAADDEAPTAKTEALGIEYSELLTSQLDSQREFYEETVVQVTETSAQLSEHLHQVQADNRNLHTQVETLTAKFALLESLFLPMRDQLESLKGEKKRLAEAYKAVSHSLAMEKELGERLSEKIDNLEEVGLELRAERDDLQEQVKDLMFFLDTKEKLKDCDEETREGMVVMKPRLKLKKKNKGKV